MELFSTSLRAEYLHKVFEILLQGRFIPPIYLFVQSCISVWTLECLFYSLRYSLILLYLLLKLFWMWPHNWIYIKLSMIHPDVFISNPLSHGPFYPQNFWAFFIFRKFKYFLKI
jgi:hypothetical protein